MKKKFFVTGFIFLFIGLLCSCLPAVDNNEYTEYFYVMNLTDEPLTIEFVPGKKDTCFKNCVIPNFQPIKDTDSLYDKDILECINYKDYDYIGYGEKTYTPGSYWSFFGIAGNDYFYPSIFKKGKKIKVAGSARSGIQYDDEDFTLVYFIVKTKLKPKFTAEEFMSFYLDDNIDEKYKNAFHWLYLFYFSYRDKTILEKEPEFDVFHHAPTTPKEFFENIKLLEELPFLLDNEYNYYIIERETIFNNF